MTSIRTKIIYGHAYLYEYKNVWTKTGSRQKVEKYLGRDNGEMLSVFARDKHTCQLCGVNNDLTIDHKVPVSAGGNNSLENLWVLCRGCNSRKGSVLVFEGANAKATQVF